MRAPAMYLARGAPRSPSATQRAAPHPAREAWELFFELWCSNAPPLHASLAELDLSLTQACALWSLQPAVPVPMNKLADSLACDASTVTGLVDRLASRGLIERRSLVHDRRVKMLVLTSEGEKLRSRVAECMFKPPAAIASLPSNEQCTLRDILRRALDGGVAESAAELRAQAPQVVADSTVYTRPQPQDTSVGDPVDVTTNK